MPWTPTYVWNTSFSGTPAQGDDPRQGWQRIEETKGGVAERMAREFYFGGNGPTQNQEGNPKAGLGRAFVGGYAGFVGGVVAIHGGLKPDSQTAFDIYDTGRLAFDTSSNFLPRVFWTSGTAPVLKPFIRDILRWTVPGPLAAGTNVVPPIGFAQRTTMVSMAAWVGTAPTGANLILNPLKNGSQQLFSTLPYIAAGAKHVLKVCAAALPSYLVCSTTDFLSFTITQIGSLVEGCDLSVALEIVI